MDTGPEETELARDGGHQLRVRREHASGVPRLAYKATRGAAQAGVRTCATSIPPSSSSLVVRCTANVARPGCRTLAGGARAGRGTRWRLECPTPHRPIRTSAVTPRPPRQAVPAGLQVSRTIVRPRPLGLEPCLASPSAVSTASLVRMSVCGGEDADRAATSARDRPRSRFYAACHRGRCVRYRHATSRHANQSRATDRAIESLSAGKEVAADVLFRRSLEEALRNGGCDLAYVDGELAGISVWQAPGSDYRFQ